MDFKDFEKILGRDLPNAMESIQMLEKGVAPIMAQVQKHRADIDPSLLSKFDESLKDVDSAREKLKEHGTFDS